MINHDDTIKVISLSLKTNRERINFGSKQMTSRFYWKIHLVKRQSGRSPIVHTMFRVSTRDSSVPFHQIDLISKDTSNSNATLKIITVHNCAPAPIRVLFRVAVLGLVRSWCKIKKSEKCTKLNSLGYSAP